MKLNQRTVGVMPGHGGRSRGTTEGGIDEADVVLDLGRALAHRCENIWPDDDTPLLRDSDIDCGLEHGGMRAVQHGCSLALVLHVNAGPPTLSGGLVFVMPSDRAARDAGRAILDAYPRQLSPARAEPIAVRAHDPEHWTRAARNVMMPYVSRGVSAVLVELFYSTARGDVAYGMSAEGVEALLCACMQGVTTHRARSAAVS
jgi:N-acetylmuramoyl-L-alanine amidase